MIRYLWATFFRHKWHMLWAGRRLGLAWGQVLAHDLSKLMPDELLPLARAFRVGADGRYSWDNTPEQRAAHARHWRRNAHHWQHWQGQEMPERYAREMVADWLAIGRDPGNLPTADWYARNRQDLHLHPNTRSLVERLLEAETHESSHAVLSRRSFFPH